MFQKAIEKPGQCPRCGKPTLYHNTGTSKTKFTREYPQGVPWENYKCSNRDCGYLEWVKQKTTAPLPGTHTPANPANNEQTGWAIMGEMQAEILREIKNLRRDLANEGLVPPPDEGEEEGL